ncbi:hypothetical protein ThidrDRAFT_2557 [Thiorhodococcus drewsii AZ1]|uniref:Uncharacterized protein n=2 Tax=Thiorhodococcus drewsii TaxID=210408 RepID=G2E2P4_9GAMM|nr:hypothetical protein ThidrDRAFT_2557 [Thiorhodococcus drewsii AZ1]
MSGAAERSPRRLRRPRVARPTRILLLCALLGLMLGTNAERAPAQSAPDVLLFGADLGEARSFTVDSAASRGWSVRAVAPTQAVFEQTLVGDENQGILTIEKLLRIVAAFREESAGVRVDLRALEIDWPETEEERMTDVTDRYRDNLGHALASLRAKWDARREDGAGARPAEQGETPGRFTPATPTSGASGTWSYAAERYAISRGCELTDRPTQLLASGPDWERHRVFCLGGSEVSVDCHYGDCTSSH